MMNHPFHLVTPSPWPVLTAISAMSTLNNSILFMSNNNNMLFTNILILISCLSLWWRDIIRESLIQGTHTAVVVKGIKIGMILFIISEAFLFLSLFWMLLHTSLSPPIQIAMSWPPKNISTINPLDIPLMNSVLLLSSGMFLTWAHYNILNKSNLFSVTMKTSIVLGTIFMMIQMYEFGSSPFTMSDSIYGSAFFTLTGFHGLHVLVGLIMLSSAFMRLNMGHMSPIHHVNFEAAAWYWHFVDVVWLLVFILLYF